MVLGTRHSLDLKLSHYLLDFVNVQVAECSLQLSQYVLRLLSIEAIHHWLSPMNDRLVVT